MPIIYRKLASTDDFDQCVELQRNLFNLSEVDIVSPLILKLFARENPPIGINIGVFNVEEDSQNMIGFILTMATLLEKSIYGTMIGVRPQYQNQGLGINLFLKLREIAIEENINHFLGVFEPLDLKLGRLYFSRLGFRGINYQQDHSVKKDLIETVIIPDDKILLKWNLHSSNFYLKKGHDFTKLSDNCPIATKDYLPESPSVLVEIPNNFGQLQKEDIVTANYWRQSTREIFNHYINNRNYVVCDCISPEENQIKKSYYLLKAQ